MQKPTRRPLILRILCGVEDTLLVSVLLTMIVFSFSQILLRNLANTGFAWGDAMLRYSVLWVGLLGAMVATREDNHINIDLVSQLIASPRVRAAIRIVTDAFTATVCSLLTYASILFLRDEMTGNAKAFASVPAWYAEIILPIAFGVIALRYWVYLVMHVIQAVKGGAMDDDGGEAP